MKKSKYLIIGNSIAGVSCLEGIRQVDPQGKITVVSDEEILNYSRPLISYYLGNKVTREKMPFREENFYRENKAEVLLKTKAENLDIKKKEVYLNRGESLGFQKLLISTGGKPIIPSIEGLDKINGSVFTFTKFEEAQKLIDYIEENNIKEAVVLGAGLIGLKCTEGLVARGLKVTIVELEDKILANTFDKNASDILERALNKWGCKVIKRDTIVKIESKKGKIEKVFLKSRMEIMTNLLIIAIGVFPNLDLVRETPIKYEKGIFVDDHLQTNIKDIYAAGDVVQGKDLLAGKNSLIPIWPVAAYQGKIAGFNMAGENIKYNGLFIMNSIEIAEVPTISFGLTNPPQEKGYEVMMREERENNFYKKIVLKNNRIVGAIFLGKIERAGIFWGLIKEKVDVSSFKEKLLNDDFGLLVLPAEYRKHLVTGEGIEV